MATKHRRIREGDSEPAVSARDSRARLRHRREWQDHRNHRIRCRAGLRKPFICHLDSAADRFGDQDRHRRRCAAARRGRQTRPRSTGAPICSKPQAARRRARQASADSHVGGPHRRRVRLRHDSIRNARRGDRGHPGRKLRDRHPRANPRTGQNAGASLAGPGSTCRPRVDDRRHGCLPRRVGSWRTAAPGVDGTARVSIALGCGYRNFP